MILTENYVFSFIFSKLKINILTKKILGKNDFLRRFYGTLWDFCNIQSFITILSNEFCIQCS